MSSRYLTSSSAYGRPWAAPLGAPPPYVPLSPTAKAWLVNGRKGCQQTSFEQSLFVSRRRPVDTQWASHLYLGNSNR